MLRLDDDATAFLLRLGADRPRRPRRRPRKETVPAGVAKLVAMLPLPAYVAAGMVAGFRESVGTDTDDPRYIELVGELRLASPLFSRLRAPAPTTPTN
ncbi:hypothetical protein [Nonomuraea sp. NPDC049480]|uniref:MmyB family transcriptional regulator n=1 Tax=Nonomuraea sp. NPDC049480 TaxID=3364353 RepID=UPI0037B85469